MKKLISFVMAGAMVASLVPATAFAKGEVTATAKVIDALEESKGFGGTITGSDVPELQLKVTGVDYQQTNNGTYPEMKVEVTLDNADFTGVDADDFKAGISIVNDGQDVLGKWGNVDGSEATYKYVATADTKADIAAAMEANPSSTKYFYALAAASTEYVAVKTLDDGSVHTTNDVKLELAAAQAAAWTEYCDDKGLTAGDWTLGTYQGMPAYTKTAGVTTLADVVYTADVTSPEYPTFPTEAVKYTVDEVVAEWTAKLDGLASPTFYTKEVDTPGTDDTVGLTGKSSREIAVKTVEKTDDDVMEITFIGKFAKDDVVAFDLDSKMTKTSIGTKATVSVDSKMVTVNDLVYATIVDKGIKASIKKTVEVAEEEVVKLNSSGLKIESAVDNFVAGQKFELKLSKGFEFSKVADGADYAFGAIDDNEVTVTYNGTDDEFTIDGDDIEIEATSAKSGTVATLTVKAVATKAIAGTFAATASVEVAKVVDYKVTLSVDEDEDVPVIYSGVNVENDGITDDSDHLSLEVTAKETFPGAWSMRQGFNFNLPEGVYVTAVKNVDAENFFQNGKNLDEVKPDGKDSSDAWEDAFDKAYKDGDHKNFEFGKRVFDDVNTNVTDNKAAEVTFQLELVADPTFEGDVKLTFEGALVDKQEVTIAKFVKPYTVKAEQNDLIIDYRNTEIKTPIVITEAEEGLWEKGAEFAFSFDKDNVMEFEDDATFEIDKDSELDVKDETKNGTLKFTIKEESDAAATVTIKDMKLFMNRSIPAGAYDLEISTSLGNAYKEQRLFAADEPSVDFDDRNKDKESFVDDVCDYSDVVKEAFVNVVTSGRDQDNLFTTKVVVPVGEKYLVAGENKVELDVAAYISDAGYTMLPVRAISKALGVNTNNVLWNAEARTVTIMYGQRIITMTVGQKTIYVNGSAIPSSAAPEIKDGRTFLPLRDLGTALGVTDVSWDAATKTATMNGGAK